MKRTLSLYFSALFITLLLLAAAVSAGMISYNTGVTGFGAPKTVFEVTLVDDTSAQVTIADEDYILTLSPINTLCLYRNDYFYFIPTNLRIGEKLVTWVYQMIT